VEIYYGIKPFQVVVAGGTRAGQHAAELTQQLLTRAEPPPAKAAGASRTLRELAHEHSGHETILLVEDDEAVRDTIGHELVVLGYDH
jgi:hypothetical protein